MLTRRFLRSTLLALSALIAVPVFVAANSIDVSHATHVVLRAFGA